MLCLVGFQPLGTADFLKGGSFPCSCGTPQKTCVEKRRCSSCFAQRYTNQSHLICVFPCKIHRCNMTHRQRPCHAILTISNCHYGLLVKFSRNRRIPKLKSHESIEWATWFLLQRLGLGPIGWNNHRPLGSADIQHSWLENPRVWSTASRALSSELTELVEKPLFPRNIRRARFSSLCWWQCLCQQIKPPNMPLPKTLPECLP